MSIVVLRDASASKNNIWLQLATYLLFVWVHATFIASTLTLFPQLMLQFKHFKRQTTQHVFLWLWYQLKANYIFTVCFKVCSVWNDDVSISSFFRYAELLGESKELSLTKKMPRSKIVYLFTISLFGMFAIEFFMKVQLYILPKRLWLQMHRLFFYMSSFAAKIFKSEHDVCCDCGV